MISNADDPKIDDAEPVNESMDDKGHQIYTSDLKFQKWSSLSMNFISLLLFIATAALAVLGYMQWRTMNMGLQQTIELIKLTKLQADASEKSAKAASDSALASSKSTQIAEQATSIAKNEFLSNRMVVWKARYDEESKSFMLTPIDSGVKLQEALIYYINSGKFSCNGIESGLIECNGLLEEGYDNVNKNINGFVDDRRIVPPLFHMDINPILATCSEQLGQTLPATSFKQLGVTSIYYFPIPVAISATYVARGELQKDTSLYYMQVSYVYDQGKVEKCRFRLLDMFFVRRLTKKNDIEAVLKERWRSVIKRHTEFSSLKKTRSLDDIIQ